MAENQDTKDAAQPDAGADKVAQKLQKQVDNLTKQVENLGSQLSEMTADRDTLATANAKLQGQNDELNVQLVEAEELIQQQMAQLRSAEVSQAHGPIIVTHEKESYQVLAPKFTHKGVDVEAASLRKNPDLVRELVEAGSGLLVKVESAG